MSVISIVDDDESVRIATADLLNSVGLSCEAFASAEAFLQSGQASRTACLILDVRMPGTNGLELQQRLAAAGHTIPIVFITAFPTETARSRAVRAGAVCFLPKPYADEDLLACVETALRGTDGTHGTGELTTKVVPAESEYRAVGQAKRVEGDSEPC
jgi:FixJ family two-component response regulator